MGRTTTLTISSPCRHLAVSACVSFTCLTLPLLSQWDTRDSQVYAVSRPVKGQRSNALVSADVRVSVTALFCHGRMKVATDKM